MPRRLPVRPQVIIGNIFVVLVSWVIGVIYYAYVFLVWLPKAEGKFWAKIANVTNDLALCYRWLEDCFTPVNFPLPLFHARVVVYTINDYWPRASACVLGLPLGRSREQETQVLSDVQHFQAWAMPSLLFMQSVCAEHGPSLPLDQ